MALGASWWSTDWRDGACLPVADPFNSATVEIVSINTLWNSVFIDGIGAIYQREFSFRGSHDVENGGMLYIRNVDTGKLTPAADLFISSGESDGNFTLAAGENISAGDIEAFDELQSVRYTNPFYRSITYPHTASIIASMSAVAQSSTGETFKIDHHAPWAWHGYPSEVAAAILLRLGVATTWIDTSAIDNAYDGEHSDHLVFPPLYAPRVCVFRKTGKTIIETIKRVAAHGWSRIGYTMSGKFACWSATRPTECAASGLLGIKGRISWRVADEHLYNIVESTFGQVCRTTILGAGTAPTVISVYEAVPNSDYAYKSEWDDSLASARGDVWSYADEDATSQAVHGVIALGGNDEVGKPKKLHHELFVDYYALVGTLARIDKFCQPLREVTIAQDLFGLDYEVGTLITDYASPDGETIDLFCISKEIDFNTLTVTSKLLEDL